MAEINFGFRRQVLADQVRRAAMERVRFGANFGLFIVTKQFSKFSSAKPTFAHIPEKK
jgi:hypothetical protein